MRVRKIGVIGTLLLGSSFAYANISGVVYKDFNLNGIKDGGDAFVSGASVTAVCEDGSTPSATTDSNGAYVITVATPGNKCRIEVDPSNAGLGSGSNAPGSAPLVDVVTDGSQHDISTASPATYCQANPDVVMAAMPGHYLHSNGTQTNPLGFGSLFKVPTPDIGSFNNNGTIDAKRTVLAKIDDTGAVWGMAYKKSTKDIFLASNLKRYVQLKGDPGAIYKVDNANNVTLFATVPNAVDATVSGILAARTYAFNKDKEILPYVGRQGLGDLDINDKETELYVVNMNTKELVVIDANNGNILNTIAIPNPYGNACPATDVRPWALKARGGDVFIGSVCDSGIESGVGASIQKYNGAIFQTIAQTNSLQYLRARTYGPKNRAQDDGLRYKNWRNDNSRGPILTDLEFTNSGDLVLGYNSRATYNRFGSLRGDIRKMCLNADGTYTDESSDITPTTCATHTVNYVGNPTDYFEFYIGDYFGANLGENGHPETASGALAQAPGAPNIIVGMVDGTDWYQPGAIGLYSNTTGDKIGAQAVIKNDKGGEREPYAAKAGGLGDVELLCDPAPIEIGNYVWEDSNQNGIQDPGEPALAGVPVKLYDNAGVLLATATTDATGHYYFGGLNSTNGVTIQPNTAYELRIAQADVNNKAPTQNDVNANADDIRDNDAIASGADNVIAFTTGVSNDHSLDFGIQPALACTEGVLFEDTVVNGTLDLGDTRAPAGIILKITDKFGAEHTVTTDANGFYQLAGIPAGRVTVEVVTSDTDIPSGALWSNFKTTLTLPESDPSGNPAVCSVSNFPYTLPAPVDQDPKDVAVCANPTSITWEGANLSSKSVWTTPMVNTPATFTTAGGATVDVTMQIINDNDGEYNQASSGTSAAFGQPYLTLYLGDQNAPGNGTYTDAANCAANGYDLVAGEKYDLEVTFAEPVILDNWRIRDVDSGDIRGGNPNWNWQDGIIAVAEDANGNPVAIESKIGSAGAGLIVDANSIVHTDPATYNGGNVATGNGSTPNATNGHIVLTSNMVPIKKLTVTHIAGPDVPCQTRSALAMAGLAVCKPLHISGTVYNDADGAKPVNACATSNGIVDGTPMSDINGTALHACLIDANNLVVDTQTLNNGAYDFDKYILPNSQYKIIIGTETCSKGSIAPNAILPTDWHYEGEGINGALESLADGVVDVNVTTSDVTKIDFGLNKIPTANGFTRPTEVNPGGTVAVTFVPAGTPLAGFITDNEDGQPARIKITTIPSNGTLYYQGNAVQVNDIYTAPNPSEFTFDPSDGSVEAAFNYVSMDKACRESEPALLKASFSIPTISGYLYLDTNHNGDTDGNATANSCDGTTPLFVNLIDKANNTVINSTALAADGSYVFYDPDVQPNTSYDLILSQVEAQAGDAVPSAQLPAGCMGTGENKGTNANNPEGTLADGKISVSVGIVDVPELNFGISPSVKIGDLVWIEDDNDGNPATGTISYPTVGTVVSATAPNGLLYKGTTDANGKYAIEVPANASYSVKVAQPAGVAPTLGSTDSSIGDATSENNKSHNNNGTTVAVGSVDNLTVDFGFTTPQTTAIGNLFWIDTNANGKVDAGEKGYNGVIVTLYDANGTKLATQTTRNGADGKAGFYLFDNLIPDKEYKVHFDYSKVAALKDYVFSPKIGGENNSNADEKGFTVSVTPKVGAPILTLDAGIHCGCTNAPIKANGGDALGMMGMLAMMLLTLTTALFFVRKEEEQRV